MKVGIVTQARMTSTRLPGKVLLPVGGKPLLQWHIERLHWSGSPVFVATTTNTADDLVAELARTCGAAVVRGSEANVLARYTETARRHELDVIVRVTSDCPLIDGHLIRSALNRYEGRGATWKTYLTNCQRRTYPRGFDFEIMSKEALLLAEKNASQEYETEHVTPYIWKTRPDCFDIQHWTRTSDASAYRITVDEPADFEAVKLLIEEFGAGILQAEEIINVLQQNPRISALNRSVVQKTV
jgi:spore coat polysaccharide biosynthesis protein SpsF